MDITVQELKQKMDAKEDFIFIDVREAHEFADFNLGAKLMPLGTVPTSIEDLMEHQEKEIVIHCRSGARSGQAQAYLQQFGFSNVRNLTGGVLAWIDAYGR